MNHESRAIVLQSLWGEVYRPILKGLFCQGIQRNYGVISAVGQWQVGIDHRCLSARRHYFYVIGSRRYGEIIGEVGEF